MSRYNLTPRNEQHEVVIGYDAPLETFFLQVYIPGSDGTPPHYTDATDDNILVWIGTKRHEYKYADVIASVAQQWATFDRQEIIKKLTADKREAKPPTPLQQRIAELFSSE